VFVFIVWSSSGEQAACSVFKVHPAGRAFTNARWLASNVSFGHGH
jgi:hypothetical protein